MKRAGLDYHDYATMKVHKNWEAFLASEQPDAQRMFAMTTHGSTAFSSVAFHPAIISSSVQKPADLQPNYVNLFH
jgi:tRNA (cytidine/uridine-2'-O-)-methyltransferase